MQVHLLVLCALVVSIACQTPAGYLEHRGFEMKGNWGSGQHHPDGREEEVYPNHILELGADRVWNELGVTGEGVVVGISLSGFDVQHTGIRPSYAGTRSNGTSFDHNYAFYSPFPGTPQYPTDGAVIGTYTAGLVASPSRHIGVAPGAKFTGCKALDDFGYEIVETQLPCYQWFLEPRDQNGMNPRPDLRPDILVTAMCESCLGSLVLADIIQALRNAGVIVVNPSGYVDGEQICGKIFRAPAFYEGVVTVGAAEKGGDRVLLESASGPSIFNSTFILSTLKPDVLAIGRDLLSTAVLDGVPDYLVASGTIPATAIVGGVLALIVSANPLLKRQVRAVEDILKHSARPLPSSQCFNNPNTPVRVPNFAAGFGSVNAYAGVLRARRYPYGGCPVLPLLDHAACHQDAGPSQLFVHNDLTSADGNMISFSAGLPESVDFGLLGGHGNGPAPLFRLCLYDSHGIDPAVAQLNDGFAVNETFSSWHFDQKGVWEFGAEDAEDATNDYGIYNVKLFPRRIEVKGYGPKLQMGKVRKSITSMFEGHDGVIAQFHAVHTGKCWSSRFTDWTDSGYTWTASQPDPYAKCNSSSFLARNRGKRKS